MQDYHLSLVKCDVFVHHFHYASLTWKILPTVPENLQFRGPPCASKPEDFIWFLGFLSETQKWASTCTVYTCSSGEIHAKHMKIRNSYRLESLLCIISVTVPIFPHEIDTKTFWPLVCHFWASRPSATGVKLSMDVKKALIKRANKLPSWSGLCPGY